MKVVLAALAALEVRLDKTVESMEPTELGALIFEAGLWTVALEANLVDRAGVVIFTFGLIWEATGDATVQASALLFIGEVTGEAMRFRVGVDGGVSLAK